MGSELEGKKLLILGATAPMCEIVKEAQSLGVTVYVTDYLPDSPAKKYADKSFMVNAIDVDAVVKLCQDEGVDGIFTGYNDMLLPYCQKVCERLGKPFCGTEENIRMCIDKEMFKNACVKSGVPVVPWVDATKDNYTEVLQNVKVPVVVKPADYSGSKGVFKCYDAEKLQSVVEEALTYSKAGKVLIEKIMDVDKEISAYYMMHDGEVYFVTMGDRYVNVIDPNIAPVGRGMLYPSIYQDAWIEKMDSRIRKFFADNDMRDGFAFIQGFYEDGDFYIHEIGYRLNGGFTYDIIKYFSGYHQMHELIRFALTGKMDKSALAKSNPHFDGLGMIVTLSIKEGVIGTVGGVEQIEQMPGIIRFHQLHHEGDALMAHGTTAQVFAYILCGTKDKAELDETIRGIQDNLVVLDDHGNSMIRDIIDPQTILVKE